MAVMSSVTDVKAVRVLTALNAIDTFTRKIDDFYQATDTPDAEQIDELVQAVIAEAMHIRQINGRLEPEVDGEGRDSSL